MIRPILRLSGAICACELERGADVRDTVRRNQLGTWRGPIIETSLAGESSDIEVAPRITGSMRNTIWLAGVVVRPIGTGHRFTGHLERELVGDDLRVTHGALGDGSSATVEGQGGAW